MQLRIRTLALTLLTACFTLNELGWANGDLIAKKRAPLFCPPEQLPIGPQTVYPLLDEFFTNHPGLSDDFPVGLAILRSLQAAFPCPTK